MECREIKYKLQELVDGSLAKEEAAAIRAHIRSCRGCAADYRLLSLAAGAIKALPSAGPGPLFNARILASLGLSCQPGTIRPAVKWAVGTALGLGSFWIVALGLGLHLGLAQADPLKVYLFAKSAGARLSDLQLLLARTGLWLIDTAGIAGKVLSAMLSGSTLPVQAAISAIVALGLISLLSRRVYQNSNI
jgi:anti-sigma factor RsiW